jgi:hypothetical protein
MNQTRQILVTAALPYANGPIHLGHLVEYIQTDIWVRFQKLRKHRCIYICADDTHGTAIMISARQQGMSEEEFIENIHQEHQTDFSGFDIQFDNYGSTHSEENFALCKEFWTAIKAAGLVKERDIQQLYDPEAKTFLADRFVTGTCPKCGSERQYGDSCDKCGGTYSTTDLVHPQSTLSGATPKYELLDTSSSNWNSFTRSSTSGHSLGNICKRKLQITFKDTFWANPLGTGIFHVLPPTLALKFQTILASIGMSGSTHRLDISHRLESGATTIVNPLTIGGTTTLVKSTISLEKTSPIFIPFSGPECSRPLASPFQPKSTFMDF